MGKKLSEEQKERMAAIRRQENYNKLKPEVLKIASELTGSAVTADSVLSMEAFDEMLDDRGDKNFKANFLALTFTERELPKLKDLVAQYFQQTKGLSHLVINLDDEWFNVKIDGSGVANKFEVLVKLLKTGIVDVHDTALENGFDIELGEDYYYADGEVSLMLLYEIRFFGKECIKQMVSAL